MIIDTHTHISDELFDENREIIINNFINAGVNKIIETGYDSTSSVSAIKLSGDYDFIYATIGLHPSVANEFNEEFYQDLINLGKNKKVTSIGEIGLDYHYPGYDSDKQKELFKNQIKIADELDLPITLHLRDAYEDSLKVLNDMKKYINNGIYLHCYSGSKELVRDYKKFGAVFGFDGPITFSNFKKFDVIREVGIDNILSETDCPYLTPVPFRGKINEPKNVIYIQKKLAELFCIDKESVEDKIWNTAHTFFRKLNN